MGRRAIAFIAAAAIAFAVLMMLVLALSDPSSSSDEGLAPEGVAVATPSDIAPATRAAFSIRGFVLDKRGTPIAGATVRAKDVCEKNQVGETATSGADGHFEVGIARDVEHSLVCEHPDYLTSRRHGIRAGDAIEIALTRGTLIRGRAIDAVTDMPLAGVAIKTSGDAETKSGADGRFALMVGVPCAFLAASVDDHLELEVAPFDPAGDEEVTLALPPREIATTPLYLRVLDGPTGAPITAIRTKPGPSEPLGEGLWRVSARAQRNLRVADVSADGHAELMVSSGGVDGHSQDKPLIVALPRRIAGSGVVRDELGRPVAAVEVRVSSAFPWFGEAYASFVTPIIAATATTDAAGRYAIESLAGGASYSIRAEHADFTTAQVKVWKAPAQGHAELPPLRLERGTTLEGIVLDATDRRPLAGALVQAYSNFTVRPVRSDAAGRFRLEHLDAETDVLVKLGGYAAHRTTSHRTFEFLEVPVERGLTIRGRVVDAVGAPVFGASVGYDRWSNEPPASEEFRGSESHDRDAVSSRDGGFVLSGLVPGKYELVARDGSASCGPVSIEAGATDAVLCLSPLTGIRIRVLDAQSQASLARYSVIVDRDSVTNPWWRGTRDTSDGTRFVPLAPSAACDLEIRADGYAPASVARVILEPGEVREHELRLERGGSIEGRLIDERGAPVPGCKLTLYFADSTDSVADQLTSDDGCFRFSSLGAARYEMRAVARVESDDTGRQETPEVVAPPTIDLRAEETIVRDLRLESIGRASVVFSLRAPESSGKVERLSASLFPIGRSDAEYEVSADRLQELRLDGVAGGEYSVRVECVVGTGGGSHAIEYTPGASRITVPDDGTVTVTAAPAVPKSGG